MVPIPLFSVAPADAGVQSLPLARTGGRKRGAGRPWVPAFAGMTILCAGTVCQNRATDMKEAGSEP
jgi:hypothetical protein